MAATIRQVTTVHLNDVTLTAGAADTNSTIQDLTRIDSATVDLKITNGATGPTVPAQFQIQTSPDNGTNYFNFGGPLVSLIGNAVVSQWGDIFLPPGTMYVRIVAGSNTDQNVTARAVVNTSTGSDVIDINTQTDSYTLVLADAEKLIDMNKATACTVTIPLNATEAFTIGTTIAIRQKGAGKVTIVATGGVTINNPDGLKTTGQFAMATILKVDTNVWTTFGSLEV